MQKEVPEIANELTGILTQIKGVKNVFEELNLSYFVVVESDEDRKNVEKVGKVLVKQAKKYGFNLDLIPVTEEEYKTAQEKLSNYNATKGTFFKSEEN